MILVNLLVFSTQTYHKMKDEMLKLTEICSATHWLWTKKSFKKRRQPLVLGWSKESSKDKLPASRKVTVLFCKRALAMKRFIVLLVAYDVKTAVIG